MLRSTGGSRAGTFRDQYALDLEPSDGLRRTLKTLSGNSRMIRDMAETAPLLETDSALARCREPKLQARPSL